MIKIGLGYTSEEYTEMMFQSSYSILFLLPRRFTLSLFAYHINATTAFHAQLDSASGSLIIPNDL